MSKLDHALELAALGYKVFPLEVNSKLPHIDGFPQRASSEPDTIRRWWIDPVMEIEQDYNIGISTSTFGTNEALLVIDVDNKGKKHGDHTLLNLELSGLEFPPTAEADTPSGGRHLIYRVARALRQGVDSLGSGLDTRSSGGYIVAAGSTLDGAEYTWADSLDSPVLAPQSLIDRCRVRAPSRDSRAAVHAIRVNQSAAHDRAVTLLSTTAGAVEGEGGDECTFRVACKVKDLGVEQDACVELMLDHWNPRCSPPWSSEELERKVKNAYTYGDNPVGSAAPERVFAADRSASDDSVLNGAPAGNPFELLNREFAFVLAGGGSHILWETHDEHGRRKLEHLAETALHKKYASWGMTVGKKSVPVTEEWMRWKGRRSFDGMCFMPGLATPDRFYNLWRGFAVEPDKKYEKHEGVEMFLQHLHANVCGRNDVLFHWLVGFFAHMVQRPWEKPLVALVFRGSKGVGKNAPIEHIGHLFGNQFLLTSNKRYLVGNFNGHLESCLLFALDEAFWSGDKQAEGVLKDLITGASHVIEHKGKEPFKVDNRTRVVVIGNEDWLVPASYDERRFGVFDVGEGRKQDRDFFRNMQVSLASGGYRQLLRFLLDYDITGLDFNEAPTTGALLEQKYESLEPLYQWWLECLTEGRLIGGDFDQPWPKSAETGRFREAFRRYIRDRNIRSRVPDGRAVGRMLKKCLPASSRDRVRDGESLRYEYSIPALKTCRECWEQYIGHKVIWE